MNESGFRIVLTADRILMADYDILLDGMTAASQSTTTPEYLMRKFVARAMPREDLRAKKAPLGLRMLEAELLRSDFPREDLIIAPPDKLAEAIGSRTELLLISSGDPLGLGMNDSTMSGIAGGVPYVQLWFERMMNDIRELKACHPALRVLVGGPGAWQLDQNPETLRTLGVDFVFSGYCEGFISELIHDILEQKVEPQVFYANSKSDASVPDLAGASSMGVVEVSRGCGLGCPFCTIRSVPMVHLPVDKIVRDVKTNVRNEATSICLISEDFLRYGSENGKLCHKKVLELAEAVRNVDGLKLIQLDHVNVSSVAQFPQEALYELQEILTRGVRHEYLWLNLGVETVNGELLQEHSCNGKLHPFRAEEWEEICENAIYRLIDAGFMPMVSLMFGIPGETPEDIQRTLEFVKRFHSQRVLFFPLFYAPVKPDQKAFTVEDMTSAHWELFRLCYDFNFKWLPKVYWDNQAGAGVPLVRRMLVQFLGIFQVLQWKTWFFLKSRRAHDEHQK